MKTIITSLLLIITGLLNAQTVIKGTVEEENNMQPEAISVALLKRKGHDSPVIYDDR